MLTFENVNDALNNAGSLRKAAKLLGKSYSSLQWWIARHGYRVETKTASTLVKADCTVQGGNHVA